VENPEETGSGRTSVDNKKFDHQKLIKYAIKTKNMALNKRVGFLLEENNIPCEQLKKLCDNNYTLLDAVLKGEGKKNKKWMIIDNRT
jgi:predicted transcriptional regulator of viral defense system